MKQVIERMHMRDVTIAYGMTETSPVSFQTGAGRPARAPRLHHRHACSRTSSARSWTRTARLVPRGTPGEFCTRGYSVMLGYWDDPERTAEAIDIEGWMHTGDLATIDDAGYGNIVGRIKDMVIRGGENIYPREVEEYLYRHPKIEDVTVVGVPDEKYGEELCAWIRLKPGESADAGGDHRLLPRPDRPLQDPALHPLRRRLPDDGDRQDPEVLDPQTDDRGARRRSRAHGLRRPPGAGVRTQLNLNGIKDLAAPTPLIPATAKQRRSQSGDPGVFRC